MPVLVKNCLASTVLMLFLSFSDILFQNAYIIFKEKVLIILRYHTKHTHFLLGVQLPLNETGQQFRHIINIHNLINLTLITRDKQNPILIIILSV